MSIRILGPHERGRFAPEAWGHLLALRAGGILTAAELEHVIDRALGQIEGRIALEDIRSLIEGAGFGPGGGTGPDQMTVH
jgi:Smg protein